jgi:hypothetical protein
VIDSDKSNAAARINDTKKRVKEEFDKGPGFAWITKGREIENYVQPAILESAVKRIYPRAVRLHGTSQFDHSLFYRTAGRKIVDDVDKVRIAREVVRSPSDLDVLDLRPMMTKLIKFIRDSNDFE